MYTKTTTIITILAAACMSTAANADVFTDSAGFNSASQNLTLIDFEGVVSPTGQQFDVRTFYASQGVEFQHPTLIGNGEISIFGSSFFPSVVGVNAPAPSAFLSSSSLSRSIEMIFTNTVTSVGFNLSGFIFSANPDAPQIRVDVLNGGTIIASELIDPAVSSDFSSFIGFSDLGVDITSIILTGTNNEDTALFVDNLAFGSVPTPGSLAVMGLGLFVASGRRRS